MTRIGSLVACALAALLSAPFAVAQSSAARWVLANEYPATSLPGEGDIFFAKAVANRVAGKLVIDAQADAKSGFKSREQLKAVAEGKVAMADSFAGALGDENPFFLLSSLPFVSANAG
jgi:TRAP-type C4-dicarboxylate transport system substrate-binding protein